MTPPTLRAIKCSERMPTREDASPSQLCVLWANVGTGWVGECRYDLPPRNVTHFFPLNRSAIATDAEEQKPRGDARKALAMALQHVRLCAPDLVVDAALEAALGDLIAEEQRGEGGE